MSELITFRSRSAQQAPPWLRRRRGRRFLYPFGLLFDLLVDATAAGVRARYPLQETDETLGPIGRDRRLPRARNEASIGYAARLEGWLATHQHNAGPFTLLEHVPAYFGAGTTAELVYPSGRRYRIDPSGVVSMDDVAWTVPQDNWSRWWLFVRREIGASSDGVWDSPGSWDDGGVWDSELTTEEIEEYAQVFSGFNAGHSVGSLVLISQLDDPALHFGASTPFFEIEVS